MKEKKVKFERLALPDARTACCLILIRSLIFIYLKRGLVPNPSKIFIGKIYEKRWIINYRVVRLRQMGIIRPRL
jgi:hypothetical protein